MRAAFVVASISLAAGCSSSGEWVYNKPNTSAVQVDRDLIVCRKESTRGTAIVLMPSQRLDREAMNRCMERKGYTVTFEK